jgi:hypothetical protein
MKKQIFQIITFAIFLMFASCGGDEVDVTPPTMEAIAYTPTPVAAEICGTQEPTVFLLTGGDQLVFDVIFSDNAALSQYKVDIHNNFDCHGHGGGSAPKVVVPNVENQTTDWTVLDIKDIVGTSAPVQRTLNVPQNVTAGNYHFQIQVVDESGNDNPAANFFALKIKNPLDDLAPTITVEQPSTSSFSVKKGDTIQFKGKVTDDRSLSDGGNGVLFLAYTDLSSGNTFTTNKVFVFDENVDKTFDYDFEYTIPQTLTTGNYRYSLGANDGVRNVANFQFFDVEVTN